MSLSPRLSLSEFYRDFYVPEVMEDPNPVACEGYEIALRYWRAITGDPPLCEITSATMSTFKQRLKTITEFDDCGKTYKVRNGSLSQNTRRKYCDHIQWVIDQAGPPMAIRRLRNAAGLIDRVPWTKPPERQRKKKPPTDEARVIALYKIVDHPEFGARFPRLPDITPAAWWRAMFSTMASTSLRIGQLVRVPYTAMVWDSSAPVLRLDADVCRKSNADEDHPLHPLAFRDLLAIRGERRYLFPGWPDVGVPISADLPHSKTTFYHEFHRLERAAGFEPNSGVAFHGIRRRVLTELAKVSPTAARLAAGHSSFNTTIQHYIDSAVLHDAVNDMEIFRKLAE